MLNTGFSPWPAFTKEEAIAVQDVLLSNRVNYWTGNQCRDFEREFASWAGVKHAIAVSNGTVAIEMALKAFDIGEGDEVIVTPRTFVASASAIVTTGATPVFADLDPENGNISAATIAQVVSPKTRAIICVHMGGWPCDMHDIMELASFRDIKVIEDCAQAHGARYNGKSVGSIGHVGTWSFCQDKIMTLGGEGGMLTTDDTALWNQLWSAKDHGKSWDAVNAKSGNAHFKWLHESFGSNYRMTEMQAAIGRIQLKRLPQWSERRTKNAENFISALKDYSGENGVVTIPGTGGENTKSMESAWYKFYIFLNLQNLGKGWTRNLVIEEFQKLAVPCFQGTCAEIYKEKCFETIIWLPGKQLPIAADIGERSIMFLVHPTLTDREIEKTQIAMKQVFAKVQDDLT